MSVMGLSYPAEAVGSLCVGFRSATFPAMTTRNRYPDEKETRITEAALAKAMESAKAKAEKNGLEWFQISWVWDRDKRLEPLVNGNTDIDGTPYEEEARQDCNAVIELATRLQAFPRYAAAVLLHEIAHALHWFNFWDDWWAVTAENAHGGKWVAIAKALGVPPSKIAVGSTPQDSIADGLLTEEEAEKLSMFVLLDSTED